MLANMDKMDAHERNLLLVFLLAVQNSPWLNETKKRVIERLLQQVADVWTSENFV